MKNYKQFVYIAYLNKAFPSKAEILDCAAYLTSLGFVFADIEPVQPAEGEAYSLGHHVPLEKEVERKYTESELPEETTPLIDLFGPVRARFTVYLPVYTAAPLPGESVIDFGRNPRLATDFEMKGEKYNEIKFITGLHDHQVDLKWKYPPVLFEIAKEYYRRYQPVYAWFDIAPTFDRTALEPILNYEFHELYWVNFFGPEYVAKYGKAFFMIAPVWKTEELADGGVLVQLSPSIMATDYPIDVIAISAYFYPAGVRYLGWPKNVLFTGPGRLAAERDDLNY